MSKISDAVEEAMKLIRKEKVLARIKKEGRDVNQAARAEAKKAKMTLDRYNDMYPSEWNAYFKFDDQGELLNVVFDGASYFQGHSGPLAVVSCHPNVTLDEIKREIEDALFQAGTLEDDDES